MPSYTIGPDQALKVLNDALTKRDDELESLRKQLSQLKHELSLTAAERDHLRSQTTRQDKQDLSLRRASTTSEERNANKPDFGLLHGLSQAPRVDDARIGRPKRILVIGGGPAGLISLHELLNPHNRPHDETLDGYEVQLYERRAEVGGVWYFEPENDIAKGWHHGAAGLKAHEENVELAHTMYKPTSNSAGDMELMDDFRHYETGVEVDKPSTNGLSKSNGYTTSQANGQITPPASDDSPGEEPSDFCWMTEPKNAPRWPSAAYEGLVGNVLPPLLEFSAHRFPKPKGGLFPSQVETHEYLLQLAEPLRPHIKTCQEVLKARPIHHGDGQPMTWQITKVDWTQSGHGKRIVEEWDAVILAAGAFDHPYYPPNIPGLQPLLDKHSTLVMHARTYPGPRPFLNQKNKIVVVGNANSANDIAAHLAPLNSGGPLYRCIRHSSNFAHLPDSRIKDVPPVASIKQSLDRATLSVTLEDGTQIDGVTKLIFASGYEYRFGWVSVPSVDDPTLKKLRPASVYGAVPDLHNGTLMASAPTLGFIGLAAGSTPMPMAEIQARTIARTWYGLMKMPDTTEELLENYHERAEELGLKDGDPEGWRQLHMIRGPPERKLTQILLDALDASEEGASQGLFRWDEWRENLYKTMRGSKEAELRRLRDSRVAAGGIEGGIGGVLSYGVTMGQKFTPVFGSTKGAGTGRAWA